MTFAEKRAHWGSLVKEWSQSNQNQLQFCQERGLNASTFKYWATKMTPPAASFKPVRIQPTPVDDLHIKIETPYGVKICVPSGTTVEDMRAIFNVLGIAA